MIVVDGGSKDKTVLIAAEWAHVISSKKGRARQMNAGALQSTGDVFLFLHADTKLPQAGLTKIKEAIRAGHAAGRFRMRFEDPHWLLRLYEIPTRFHPFSYGDQGFFVCREIFERLGGFRENAPFEDIDFYQRLCRLTRPVILHDSVTTSARRFRQSGFIRQKFVNLFLVGLYYLGFDVFKLKDRLYPEIR